MKRNLFQLLAVLLILSAAYSSAQTTETLPRDNFYDEQRVKDNAAIPYDFVSENDVYWHKRIWRVIDMKEKMNLPFRYEGIDWTNLSPLITTLRSAALSGEMQVYDDETFKTPMTVPQVQSKGAGFDTIPVQDLEGNVTHDTVVEHPFDPNKVLHWRIKEDWFFNKKTSQMQVRIIGIAPMYYDEEAKQEYSLFWVYYPNARNILAKAEVFNPQNDAQRWTFEDLFEMRMFSSTIYKESNLFDRRITEYATGLDALRESDRIKNDIFNYEHDLWSF
ncbi:MAG TPA: gliding motility protein GldN [Chitinophagales bacterium]|nr:gliding motility protein GldN [Chitinophagales bacterium]